MGFSEVWQEFIGDSSPVASVVALINAVGLVSPALSKGGCASCATILLFATMTLAVLLANGVALAVGRSLALLIALINPVAWKVNSTKFTCTILHNIFP
jgi:hypothetical protein